MKIVKKIILVFVLMIVFFFTRINTIKATTVTVSTSVLKMREKASTSSDVVAMLSEGVECELIEESGDWYKVTYKSYTGYVSKEYVTVNDNTEEVDETDDTSNYTEDTSEESSSEDNSTVKNTSDDTEENEDAEEEIAASTTNTGKISSDTEVQLTPLIYSTSIGTLEKNTSVTIITDLGDWLYVQTSSIEGWVRSSSITDKASTSSTTSESSDTSYTEKTMYVSESSVNVRKEASTSADILMVLSLNTELTVVGESGDWYEVETSKGTGYVAKTLLSSSKTTN